MVETLETKSKQGLFDKVKGIKITVDNFLFDLGMYLYKGVPMNSSDVIDRGNLITYGYISPENIAIMKKSD